MDDKENQAEDNYVKKCQSETQAREAKFIHGLYPISSKSDCLHLFYRKIQDHIAKWLSIL